MGHHSKKQLEERKNRKDRITALLKSPGWKEIETIISEEFQENLEKLLVADDPAARGAINAIKNITEKISDEIEFGKAAEEQFRKQYINKISLGE